MPTALAAYEPQVLVDTSELTEEAWLQYRRLGIGGSDAAAVLGISPWTTARDLYYDKRGIVSAIDDSENWVQLEVGHLLEDLVGRIFAKKSGFTIIRVKKMFQHPHYPFMLADIDFLVELPDGTRAILECKTTNSNAKDKWWDSEGREIVPAYYVAQGRHYMAVLNISRVYYCCLYDNSEDSAIIRHIDRDLECESELICLEEEFWVNHVQAEAPPPYTEDGELVAESVRRHFGPAVPSEAQVTLAPELMDDLTRYLELQSQKKLVDAQSKALENEMKRIKGFVADVMGPCCTAACLNAGGGYTVTYNPVRKNVITKDNMERLALQHPEIYAEYVTISESRRLNVRQISQEAAAA